MGRRKERRLAAKSAGGRRVKLDLLAEPSGDLGGSCTLEDVGGEVNSRTHAESPSSPSSSGKQLQNPLMLLEQYSDEELDDDSNVGHNHAENASVDMDEESKVAAAKEAGDGENINDNESSQKVEQFLVDSSATSQGHSKKESIMIDSDDLHKQRTKKEEATYAAALEEHPDEEVRSGWKMVLHEESNQYYYWNVVTGETSWEVPHVLAQENVETSSEKVSEGKTDVVMGTYNSNVPLDTEEDTTNVHSKINSQTANDADQRTKMAESDERFKVDSIEVKEGNGNANQDNGTSLLCGHSTDSQNDADLSSQLIKHCESLLERLNSSKCLNCDQEGQDLKLKCKLEIEVRLADINALAYHGSLLLPFWLHSDDQLKRIEDALDTVLQQVDSAYASGFHATVESHEGGHGTETDSSREKELFVTVESHAGDSSVKSTFEAHNDGATTTEHIPFVWYSNAYPVNNVGGKTEITGTEKGNDLNLKPVHHSVEDVDMDVDMEVEDTSSLESPCEGASGAHISTDLSNVHNTLSDQEPKLPGVFVVAPPDKEWIPPPPPDNEPIPPPPPDDEPIPLPPPEEPPETSFSQSHLGSVQAFPYSEQYALSYPGSGLEYYVQTNPEVSSATFYTQSEGGQVAPSNVPLYYEAASNVYAVAPLIVNSVDPATYYCLQNGNLNPVPLMNSVSESSGTHTELVPEETAAGSQESCPEPGSKLLLKNNINAEKSCHGTTKVVPEVRDAQISIGASAISTVSDTGFVPSTSTTNSVSAAAAAAATKAQSKVPRTKKRKVAVVSTLKSNKKVSSLVDKWKAAKEELHEEEEEPEDPYEILEKKRQREIEQWRAQQIATGEAKDNANFQPLGGDWRERVKRRRAEKMKGSERSSPDVAIDGNQQTDLSELSKGLPSGWQAYWDDSSKQFYYGNVLTSETTWIRPTE